MVGFIAIFVSILCVGLFILSFSQGEAKASARLSSLLRELEPAHLRVDLSQQKVSSPTALFSLKYAARRRAEQYFLRATRVAVLSALIFIVYTNFVLKTAPFIVKVVGVAVLVGCVFPILMIKRGRERRRQSIERSLVDIVDLVVIGLEAGMTLPAVLREIVHQETNPHDPLRIEVEQMLSEIDAGLDLNKAMQGLAVRCEIEEMKMLASAVVQAERVGSGLAQSFRVYGEELRSVRREKIRTLVQKLPVKIMLTAMPFFLLAMLLVVGGPAFITLGATLSKFGG